MNCGLFPWRDERHKLWRITAPKVAAPPQVAWIFKRNEQQRQIGGLHNACNKTVFFDAPQSLLLHSGLQKETMFEYWLQHVLTEHSRSDKRKNKIVLRREMDLADLGEDLDGQADPDEDDIFL